LAVLDDEKVNLDLIEELLRYIVNTDVEGGAVLVFLPGLMEITVRHHFRLCAVCSAYGRSGVRRGLCQHPCVAAVLCAK
jgi:hypothetical protein